MTANVRQEPAALAEINITPLVDVMLVLLIIFMIAAPILAHQIPLDLPQSQPDPPVPVPTISLRLAGDGVLYWDGQPMPAAAIDPQLRLEARRAPQPELVIDAARDARYDAVAGILASAKSAGIKRIGFKDTPSN